MGYGELVKIVEDVVGVYYAYVVGVVAGGRLLVRSNAGGANAAWVVDLATGEGRRLTDRPVYWLVEPPVGASRVVYSRDVSGGRELQLLYVTDVERGGEEPLVSMEPLRIVSIVDVGDGVVFTGATMEDMAIYMARRGSVEKIYKLPALAVVTDVAGNLAVGFGMFKSARSQEL
ncbi:MAG: hypothetical protein ACK4SY_10460, partial [Pyrobaculum sp.]